MNEIVSGANIIVGKVPVTVATVDRVSITGEHVTVDVIADDQSRWSLSIFRGEIAGKRTIGWGSSFETPRESVTMEDVLASST